MLPEQLQVKTTKGSYRPEIDGLRAFAVIAVIINHFNRDLLPGGYLGVDIFFVISGYVITSSLYERPAKSFKDFVTGFYERRVKRLVPALAFFVAIASLSICLFNPAPGVQLDIGVRSLFGISNIALYKQSTDYFAQSTELNIFTHTWSLGVEEQFYILFPFLVWFSGFGKQSINGARNLSLAIGVIAIASLISFLHLYSVNQPAAYFLMPPRLWEIATGCLTVIGLKTHASIESFLKQAPPLLISALMIGVMFLPFSVASISTVAIVALSSILIACLKKQTVAFKLFAHPYVVSIGLISYSLYLWHWGVLSISRWTIGIHWWSVPFQVALMISLATFSYRWIETPLRKRAWFGSRWKTLLIGGGVLVAVATGLNALSRPMKGRLFVGHYKYESLISRSRGYASAVGTYNGKNCHRDDNSFVLSELLSNCVLKGSGSTKTFYFVGNSHADHYRETHYLLNKRDGISVASMTISSCLFPHRSFEKCKNSSQDQIEAWLLGRLTAGDVVVISNRHIANSERFDQDAIDYPWMNDKSTLADINAFNKAVLSKGGRMVLMLPLPEYDLSMEECKPFWFKPFKRHGCSKTIEAARAEHQAVYSLVAGYLDRSIVVYDPLPKFCDNGLCSMTDARRKPLYVDKDHITDYANRQYIYPDFRVFLAKKSLI